MPSLELTQGAYASVESCKSAINIQTSSLDELILEHVLAASRDLDLELGRRFFPYTGMNPYRWPPLHVAYSWRVWTGEDLLSVSSLQVAAAGQNAQPVTLTHYFLEPADAGPPYNRVEVDLSSSDVFQAGPTPQRSVQITGAWGYCSTLVSGGVLGAAISSTTATSITLTPPIKAEQGDVLLIDQEALYVDVSPSLSGGIAVVQRGVNGTTAATHLNGATVSKYQAPLDIRRMVRADALASFAQDQASWGRTIGAGDLAVEYTGKMPATMRQRIVNHYQRKRSAAV